MRIISLHEQVGRFRLRWREWRTKLVTQRRSKSTCKLVSTGPLCPFDGGTEYRTRIEYDGRVAPRVWIESPELKRRDPDEPIPHMYGQECVCAFMPQVDWARDMYVADYVPGRVAQWLFFYELWRSTGIWYGGGVHPEPSPKILKLATRIDAEVPLE